MTDSAGCGTLVLAGFGTEIPHITACGVALIHHFCTDFIGLGMANAVWVCVGDGWKLTGGSQVAHDVGFMYKALPFDVISTLPTLTISVIATALTVFKTWQISPSRSVACKVAMLTVRDKQYCSVQRCGSTSKPAPCWRKSLSCSSSPVSHILRYRYVSRQGWIVLEAHK